MIERIVSGGQTGVDRGALDAALACGFPCGGWCPAGRMAEDGVIDEAYPLVELQSAGYAARTTRNVEDSDGTLLIHFGELEGGTRWTLEECRRKGKPHLVVHAREQSPIEAATTVAEFAERHAIRRLNVAGPRASKERDAHGYAFELIDGLLMRFRRR